jgi:ABC-type Zn uptake system ZnuABC Zn-binding protein ZnuA
MHKRLIRLPVGALIVFAGLGVAAPQSAPAQVRVVTSTPTLADITRQVGGDHVKVESIMRGPENVHNVSPKPSFMMKLRKADLFIHSGLDAEPWVPLLIKGARNSDLLYGQPGNVDVSPGIALKEVPKRGELSRALGDIHVYGNTHYALDPLNGVVVARTIALALTRADPLHRNDFDANSEAFAERMRTLTERLTAEMAPYRGTPVVTYHRTWPYFLDRFGLVKVAEVEPKPGIAPGPQHLTRCVETMEGHGAKVVIVETYNPKKNADNVARRVQGEAVVLAQGVRAVPEADTYEKLFEHNVGALLAAFETLGIEPRTDTSRP